MANEVVPFNELQIAEIKKDCVHWGNISRTKKKYPLSTGRSQHTSFYASTRKQSLHFSKYHPEI